MTETSSTDLPAMTAQPTPVLSLRDVVVYPHMVIPLFVGRERSILALDRAMDRDKRIVLVTQRSAEIDDPAEEDLFRVGTLATVLQLLKLPDGTVKVLVEGRVRVKIEQFVENESFFEATTSDLVEEEGAADILSALQRSVAGDFERYVKVKKNVPDEALSAVMETSEPDILADLVSGHLGIEVHSGNWFILPSEWSHCLKII